MEFRVEPTGVEGQEQFEPALFPQRILLDQKFQLLDLKAGFGGNGDALRRARGAFRDGIQVGELVCLIEYANDFPVFYTQLAEDSVPLITVNSWNEWTETSYLEPDDLYGYGYLEAIKRVFRDS